MYIYLKNNADLEQRIEMLGTEKTPYFMGREFVHEHSIAPRITMISTPTDVLMQSEDLKKVFLKATKFLNQIRIAGVWRKHGIYHYGRATCILTQNADGNYKMEISTDFFDGLKDIDVIFQKIMAGKITPTISFEEEQVRKHPLEILRQLLAEKPLTKIERFFLSWRLSRI